MIWSSRVGKLGVVLASVGAHGLAAYMFWGDPEILRIDGGAEAAVQARLGNSFADMAAGTISPETPETLEEVEPTEVAEPITPDTPVEHTDPELVTEAAQPEEIQRAEVDATDRVTAEEAVEVTRAETATETVATVQTQKVNPELAEVETPTEQLITPAVTTPVRADPAAPEPVTPLELLTPAPTVTEPEAIEAFQPQQTVIAAAPPAETLQALPEEGVEISPRPQVRPQSIEQQAGQRRTQQQAPRLAPRGNAQQNAVAGSETGGNQAAAPRQLSTNTGRNTAAGNAAVSNYPGRVMRCISRASRPRVNSSGTTVVAFSISANGRVGQVRLARSSGNARLDRAAIQTISRAGPCPAPPAGARRSFQISIKGRG